MQSSEYRYKHPFEDDEDDDLVTLFRKKNFSEKTIKEVEKLQDMVKVFIYQKKIYAGSLNHKRESHYGRSVKIAKE